MLEHLVNLSIISSSLRIATPILLASLAGTISERSGVINIGIEGVMLLSAFAAAFGSFFLGAWPGVLVGVMVGGALGLVHAFMSITVRSDQVVNATAVNILAIGLPNIIISRVWKGYYSSTPIVPVVRNLRLELLDRLPVVGKVFGDLNPIVYVAFLLVPAMHVLLFKTRVGLRIRAVGELPIAADTLGVNVPKLRYLSVIASGMLAGLGGAYLSICYQSQFSMGMTEGRGFIGLAAMIFGRWTPVGAMAASILFGLADAFQANAQSAGLPIPAEIMLTLPYVLTLLALIKVAGKRVLGPAAAGQPYVKN